MAQNLRARFRQDVNIDVRGVQFVVTALGNMKKRVRNKLIRRAMKKATRALWHKTRKAAPHDTYALYKSFVWEVKTPKDKDYTIGVVGPAARGEFKYYDSRGKRKSPSAYSWMTERGTKPRRTAKGAFRGQIKPMKYMEKTVNSFRSEFHDMYMSDVTKAIKDEWDKQ